MRPEKVPTFYANAGSRRTVYVQETADGVLLLFRRPIHKNDVVEGSITSQPRRRIKSRVELPVLLSEESAEAAYQVLRAWHKKTRWQRHLTAMMLGVIGHMMKSDQALRKLFR